MSCAAEVDAQRVYAWRVWDKLTKSYNIRGTDPPDANFAIHGATEFRYLIYTMSR
jgi:hypothetical protein